MVPWAMPGMRLGAARRGLRRLALGVALLACAACSLLQPRLERPEISVSEIAWVGGNLAHQDFKVTLNIHNPNGRSLPVAGLNAELRVGGESVATVVRAEPFVVPAQADAPVAVTLRADLARVLLKLLQQSGPLDYELSGVVNVDLPFVRSLPFSQKGVLPASK